MRDNSTLQQQALDSRGGAWLRRLVVIGILVAVVLPLLPPLVYSFSGRWLFPSVLPSEWSPRAWRYVLAPRSRVLEAFFTSLAIACSVTSLSVLFGVPAGRGLSALPPVLRGLLEFLFFTPIIVPALAVALGLHVAFIRIGISDTLFGVVVSHLLPALPYMVLVMTSTFTNANEMLESQARTLGAGPIRAFLSVGLPNAIPGVLTGALFVFLISWSQYALTLLIGGGRIVTLPILLFAFASSGDYAITGALSVVFLVPAIVILAITARYLTGRSIALAGVAK
jgi:putative spermidine/putrescine transport system permease protein